MIVADVNLVVYLLTDCEQRPLATALYEHEPVWRLPRLWRTADRRLTQKFPDICRDLTQVGDV